MRVVDNFCWSKPTNQLLAESSSSKRIRKNYTGGPCCCRRTFFLLDLIIYTDSVLGFFLRRILRKLFLAELTGSSLDLIS